MSALRSIGPFLAGAALGGALGFLAGAAVLYVGLLLAGLIVPFDGVS